MQDLPTTLPAPSRSQALSRSRSIVLTTLALLAFAGNSLLCRAALRDTDIDAASFTAVRLIAGALVLWVVLRLQARDVPLSGSWRSALALFAYAAAFSFAYLSLPAGSGALILFGAVQISMIGWGMRHGERPRPLQVAGFLFALAGLIGLLAPGLSAPPLRGALLMMAAGLAWGIYSLRGKSARDPLATTAGNFLRAVPMAIALAACLLPSLRWDIGGLGLAIASGALTSGLGYVIWYTALPALRATTAATVQLSVPMIAALGGTALLGEPWTWRLALASLAVLGGIALVVTPRKPMPDAAR